MGTVLPNSQCAMGALPSNHRITITDLFSWISLDLKGIHTLWVVAKVLVTASSFHRPSGMLHTLRQVIDQDWMQQSSVSIYNLSAAYVCHSNQLHMLQFTIETKLNMAIYQHSVGSLNLQKRKTTFQHMLPHQSKFFSLPSLPKIRSKTKTGFGKWQDVQAYPQRFEVLSLVVSQRRRPCHESKLTPWKTWKKSFRKTKKIWTSRSQNSHFFPILGVICDLQSNVSKIVSQ